MNFYVLSLFDGTSNTIIARYEIERIMFYANGVSGTNEASCFAFSWAHGDTKENALFQCHVFRCSIPEAVCPFNYSFNFYLFIIDDN